MIPATLFIPPNGKTREIELLNVSEEDSAFFNDNEYAVSLEEIEGQFVIYVDIGLETEEGEPDEEIYIVPPGEECDVSFSKIRSQIETKLKG
jgi:hypothetical protein